MARKFLWQYLASLSLTLSVGVSVIPSLPIQAQVQPRSRQPLNISVAFEPPKDGEGTPVTTRGGASRGNCPLASQETAVPLTALMPAVETPDLPIPSLTGRTVAANPTFFVYIPDNSIEEVIFNLRDRDYNLLYQTTLPTPSRPGIISFTLPEDAPPLKVNHKYAWHFGMVCQAQNPAQISIPEIVLVSGEIKRSEPSSALKDQLQKVAGIEKAAVYAKNGIWTEALATLAQLRRSQPDDSRLIAAWEELLNSVGLEKVAKEPLVE